MPNRRRLAFLALAAWSAIALVGASAQATPQTFVSLEYDVAPDAGDCLADDEFRAAVARQLHYDPFRSAADRRVAVQIARKEIGFDGRIRWTDAEGNWVGDRRLTSRRSDCAEIAASLAFSVAVQVQLLSTLAPPAPEPPPPPPPPAPEVSPTVVVAPPPEPPPAPPATPVTLSLGLGPALALGLAPQATGLGRVFVSGRLSWASLELSIDGALPTTQLQVDGSGFSLDRFAGGAAACGHDRWLSACVTATVGLLRARGVGVDAPSSPAGMFAQAGGRIAATYDLGDHLFVAGRVDGLVMLAPWSVRLNDYVAWTTPRVGTLIGVDLGAHL